MSIIVFVDDMPTEDGKYRVVQEDSETKEPFGVKDFDTEEEAVKYAEDIQRAIDKGEAERSDKEISDEK
ncbi:MAG TPA: hypothetical protein VGP58_12380 [Pyrinomonadaceae bacterium]|jgi:hypothetical protein|nr:hypothetical protein [Pyrinomonadaceae bacterium]